MRLFLIRHGETVDNVAQLYAGSRDSDLTNHGHQQATRLGQHFHATGIVLTHAFSSHLKRAKDTAGLVLKAQEQTHRSAERTQPKLIHTPLLVEQDFGSLEGVSYMARPLGSTKSGKDALRENRKADPGFVDVESKDSMALRADTFLDEHLLAILDFTKSENDPVVAIVSHGIFLSVLWRRLLQRLPPQSVTYHRDLLATHGNIDLERLGGWSNTGYLDLQFLRRQVVSKATVVPVAQVQETATAVVVSLPNASLSMASATPSEVAVSAVQIPASIDSTVPEATSSNVTTVISEPTTSSIVLTGWTLTIKAINSKKHLAGLKRTGGGVGSSRHDSNQKSLDTFFKRRKVG